MDYQIDFVESVYIKDLYDIIIPQIKDYFHAHREKRLVFNFAGLHFISPSIVPNLMNIANIYKKFFNGKTIYINFSWNTDLLSYLSTVNFFKFTNKYKLFDYNTEIQGDFKTFDPHENCRMIYSEKDSIEDEIVLKINYLLESMGAFRRFEKGNKKIDDIKEMFRDILFNLIDNANDEERGNSNAYAIFQINKYKENKVAYISICDAGVGISTSIGRKFLKNEAFPLFTGVGYSPTYYYILEALFWRFRINKPPYIHGLYHTAEYVLGKGGKIGIHSDDTYVLFTDEFWDNLKEIKYIIDGQNKSRVSLTDKNNNKLRNSLSPKIIKLLDYYAERHAKTRKYQGVHIDIEFPLGEFE